MENCRRICLRHSSKKTGRALASPCGTVEVGGSGTNSRENHNHLESETVSVIGWNSCIELNYIQKLKKMLITIILISLFFGL